MHDAKDEDDKDAAMAYDDESGSVSCADKQYVYEVLIDEDAEDLKMDQKERMEIMVVDIKSHFTKISQMIPNFGEVIQI